MKKVSLLIMLLTLGLFTAGAQKTFKADPAATVINWHGKKIGREHTGVVALKEGWLKSDGKLITAGEFTIDMTTIKDVDLKDDGMRAKLEGHLKSDDFFGVATYPLSKIIITSSSLNADGTLTVRGNITIKAATHPVEFIAKSKKSGDITIWSAVFTINRALYDVRYGSGTFFSNLGDNAINDDFTVEVKLAVKK